MDMDGYGDLLEGCLGLSWNEHYWMKCLDLFGSFGKI